MSSLRQDSLTGRWVIIAAQRQGRPNEFRHQLLKMPDQLPSSDRCPFCPGRENQTPPELVATGRTQDMVSNSPGWRVRVVPNKYPAVKAEPGTPDTPDSSLLRPQGPAQGGHEVVVCCPGHQDSLGTLPNDHLTEVLSVVRQRMQTLEQENPSARYVLAFGNHGPEAGATLAHAHLQIITTPVVPALVVDKTENFIRYKATKNSCLLCDCLAEEEAARTRLIAANNNWVAATPWASRFPCEMRLMPRRHSSSMVHCSDAELADLADLMSLCLKGLDNHAPDAGYNLVIHNAPLAADSRGGYGNDRLDSLSPSPDHFHWHLEILPRLTRQAGFEAGTGFAINSLPPEEAAGLLRPERR
jgi:UDPglucose--hexose-1-phosphate uridylyltransferase